MQSQSKMRNYGLPINEQKFKREELPVNYKSLRDFSTEKDLIKDEFYHLRDNGEWWLIKGTPIYVSGSAWFYFNCWTLQEITLPDFHIEAVEFYQVLDWIERTPSILGMLLVKGRQEGATSKINCWLYNRATRYKGAHIGLMGDDEARAKTNLAKITIGHNRMIDLFNPISKGTTKTVGNLTFTIPEKKRTINNIEELKDSNFEGLESDITFKTGLGSYDGDRLFALYFDECFKTTAFDIYKQLDILKPAFKSKRTMAAFSGKIIYASTVEDKKKAGEDSSKTLATVATMWEDSDPTTVDSYGRTKTGLVRYFRDILNSAPVDEWGFCKKAELLDSINAEKETFIKTKDWDGLASFNRKNPLSINDALQISAESCPLFPHLIEMKLAELRNKVDQFGNYKAPVAVRGNLVFTDDTWLKVRWIPDPKGKWVISQHPDEPNARAGFLKGNKAVPKNAAKYKIACDPTDVMEAVSKKQHLSKTGITVKRALDKRLENLSEVGFYEHEGIELCRNPRALKTNRIVCTYYNRNDDPEENVQDCIKTAVYFGAPIIIEKNSPYTYNRFLAVLPNYLSNMPKEGKSATSFREKRRNEKGWRTTAENKSTLTDCTVSYFANYIENIEHQDYLEDARRFNGKNHTDCDLLMSGMIAEVADSEGRNKEQKDEDSLHWETNVFV